MNTIVQLIPLECSDNYCYTIFVIVYRFINIWYTISNMSQC